MSSQPPTNPKGVVLVMQIINASLIMGLAIFLAVAVLLTQDQQPQAPKLTNLALGYTALAAVLYFVIRLPINVHRLKQASQGQSFHPQSDEVFLAMAPTYQTERIIRLAIIEGAGFFSGVAYMTEKIWWNLAAIGLVIFLMLLGFPSRSRINAWIERRTLGLQFGDSNL